MEREYQVEEFLDKERKNYLIAHYTLLSDFSTIEKFAVIFLTMENNHWVEVFKIDGNQREEVHIHFSYSKKAKKNIE